jgi:DinB superfamily
MSEWDGRDLSGLVAHEVVLSGAKLLGVLLDGATIDGVISGLVINDVLVEPLITAELDRRSPERLLLRSSDPDELRQGWAVLEEQWAGTLARASALPEEALHRQVEGEWSLVQTLRHLVFATDAWFGRTVLGQPRPYHPLGLVAGFLDDVAAQLGLDTTADPSLAEVLPVREDRLAMVREFLAEATKEDLERTRPANPAFGFPPAGEHTALRCVHVLMSEEWAHHRFAVRDLTIIEQTQP